MLGLELFLARSDQLLSAVPVDLLIIAEATAAAMVLNQSVKFLIGRERPFVHALPPEQRGSVAHPSDNNLSFYSGHASFAFALTAATGTVARLRGYRYAWLVWAVGLPLAASVPLLRMAADRHYLSDVLLGSAVGGLFGVGLPTLLHGRLEPKLSEGMLVRISPTEDGLLIAGSF